MLPCTSATTEMRTRARLVARVRRSDGRAAGATPDSSLRPPVAVGAADYRMLVTRSARHVVAAGVGACLVQRYHGDRHARHRGVDDQAVADVHADVADRGVEGDQV